MSRDTAPEVVQENTVHGGTIGASTAPAIIPREQLTVVRTVVDERIMALGALMTREEMQARCRRSPVGIYHQAVGWCRHIFDLELLEGSDARQGLYEIGGAPRPDGRMPRALVRAFSRGRLQFQRSKRRGAVRELVSYEDQLREDLEEVDFFLCIDTRKYPEIHIYKMRSGRLLRHYHDRGFSLSGMSARRFDRFVRENHEIRWRDVNFQRLLREAIARDPLPAQVGDGIADGDAAVALA